MADRKSPDTVSVKEMGIDHAEFFRVLPKALGSEDYRVTGNRIRLGDDDRHLEIALAPEGRRSIASLSLPVTRVSLAFHGYSDAEIAAALERFDLAFQRGGG